MELPKRFKFIYMDDDSTVFHAKITEDSCDVTWGTNWRTLVPVTYTREDVEEFILEGSWQVSG